MIESMTQPVPSDPDLPSGRPTSRWRITAEQRVATDDPHTRCALPKRIDPASAGHSEGLAAGEIDGDPAKSRIVGERVDEIDKCSRSPLADAPHREHLSGGFSPV